MRGLLIRGKAEKHTGSCQPDGRSTNSFGMIMGSRRGGLALARDVKTSSNGEAWQEFSIVLTARPVAGQPTPSSESSSASRSGG